MAYTRGKIQKAYEFYNLHYLHDAIIFFCKKIYLKFLLICLTRARAEGGREGGEGERREEGREGGWGRGKRGRDDKYIF